MTLAHESGHLVSHGLTEAQAECYAVQRTARAAGGLGATAAYARELAETAWLQIYPTGGDEYRSRECENGGALDLAPGDAGWPCAACTAGNVTRPRGAAAGAAGVQVRAEKELSRGRARTPWALLHPADRRGVDAKTFADCAEEWSSGEGAPAIRVLGVGERRLTRKGLPAGTRATIVIMSVEPPDEDAYVAAYPTVRVDGRWRWILGEEALAALREGDCPDWRTG